MDPTPVRAAERDLIERYAALAPDDPARAGVREALIVMHQPLVRALAQRYGGRGEPLDDLVQAGSIGLIQAVDRFDPARADSFTSYAVATILGEIRRHFRDRTWSIRIPRRMQDLSRAVTAARGELEQTLHRAPTVPELARARRRHHRRRARRPRGRPGVRHRLPRRPAGRRQRDAADR